MPSRATGGRLPSAEQQQMFAVQAGQRGDRLGQRGRGAVRFAEAADRTVYSHKFKSRLLAHGHHHLLQLGLGAEADQPDFTAGHIGSEMRCFVQRACSPWVEYRGQHHLVLKPGPAGSGDWLQGL
jgi:hypothetical protein